MSARHAKTKAYAIQRPISSIQTPVSACASQDAAKQAHTLWTLFVNVFQMVVLLLRQKIVVKKQISGSMLVKLKKVQTKLALILKMEALTLSGLSTLINVNANAKRK